MNAVMDDGEGETANQELGSIHGAKWRVCAHRLTPSAASARDFPRHFSKIFFQNPRIFQSVSLPAGARNQLRMNPQSGRLPAQ
jgi:hypothetical protein